MNLRIYIIKIIKEVLKYEKKSEDDTINIVFNEKLFVHLINEMINFINIFYKNTNSNAIEEYSAAFIPITDNFQTFNKNALNLLYKKISKFSTLYKYYDSFTPIQESINSLKSLITSNNMGDECLKKIDEILLLSKEQNNKIKQLCIENNDIKDNIGRIKKDMETYDQRIKDLENKFAKVKEHLKCPITNNIMVNPVITSSGHSYENNAFLNYIHQNHLESIFENHLYYNIALKNVIEELKK